MKFSKYLLLLVAFVVVLSSCERRHRIEKEEELARLESYIKSAQAVGDMPDTVSANASGLYYIERKTGNGTSPITVGDEVTVRFDCYIDNDSILFASNWREKDGVSVISGNTSASFPADIDGFHEGIGMMRNGGEATLLIPSTLAYGGNGKSVGSYYTRWGDKGTSSVAGYTTIRFEIKVTNHKPVTNN